MDEETPNSDSNERHMLLNNPHFGNQLEPSRPFWDIRDFATAIHLPFGKRDRSPYRLRQKLGHVALLIFIAMIPIKLVYIVAPTGKTKQHNTV